MFVLIPTVSVGLTIFFQAADRILLAEEPGTASSSIFWMTSALNFLSSGHGILIPDKNDPGLLREMLSIPFARGIGEKGTFVIDSSFGPGTARAAQLIAPAKGATAAALKKSLRVMTFFFIDVSSL